MMTRVILSTSLATLLLVAAMGQGQAQSAADNSPTASGGSEWPGPTAAPRPMHPGTAPPESAAAAAAIQPSAGGDPEEHHALIAALQACGRLAEESRRTRCEMQARKTDGAEVKLSRGSNESIYSFRNYP